MVEQDPEAAVSAVEAKSVSKPPAGREPQYRSEGIFCYRCGEDGHFATKCRNSENPTKVIRKLIHALKVTKDKYRSGDPTTKDNCGVKKSVVTSSVPNKIPEGLIDPPSIVPVKVNGHCCNALFDSGFQVTIIFESYYQTHLSDVPIQPVSGLALWGLSESDISYPYRGYVVVEIKYPAKMECVAQTVAFLLSSAPSLERRTRLL